MSQHHCFGKILLILFLLNFSFEIFATSPRSRAVKHASKHTTKKEPSVCRLMEKPENLYSATAEDLTKLALWRARMLTTKQDALTNLCLKTCQQPSAEMISFCNGLSTCQNECTAAKIIKNNNCMNSSACVQKDCSPMPDRNSNGALSKKDNLVRSKIFIAIANEVVSEFLHTHPKRIPNDSANLYRSGVEFAKAYLLSTPNSRSSYATYLPQTMRCLNNVENPSLEPIMQNGSYMPNAFCGHAFGLGQVAPETFYSNFGIFSPTTLSVQPLRNPCRNGFKEFTIGSLPAKCDNGDFQAKYYRIEILEKYAHLTPQQIHNMRPFDIELQIRLMMAVIVNKIIQTRNWRSAFTSYGGTKYARFTGQHTCVQNNTLKTLESKTERLKAAEGI